MGHEKRLALTLPATGRLYGDIKGMLHRLAASPLGSTLHFVGDEPKYVSRHVCENFGSVTSAGFRVNKVAHGAVVTRIAGPIR